MDLGPKVTGPLVFETPSSHFESSNLRSFKWSSFNSSKFNKRKSASDLGVVQRKGPGVEPREGGVLGEP